MQKWLTDLHTHSDFSFDSKESLAKMLKIAHEKGLAFYGVSEHFNYDACTEYEQKCYQGIDEESYFHTGRHLQEDYAGCLNVLIGAEFGFTPNATALGRYVEIVQKYRPDYVINSIHDKDGWDYYTKKPYYDKDGGLLDKTQVYVEYFRLVLDSLSAPYPYDIVGHLGYCARYAPYEDTRISFEALQSEIDAVLKTIIAKDKILELNASTKDGSVCVPDIEIIKRYYELGGRKISYGSDAHYAQRVADKRDEVIKLAKEIGFSYITVPCNGEHIKVEI